MSWTNFYNSADRPKKADEIATFVHKQIFDRICDQTLDRVASEKEGEAKTKIESNLKTLRNKTKALLGMLEFFETLGTRMSR